MDKYKVLKSVIDDYIKNIHRINNLRVESATIELEYVMDEVKAFNLLNHNIKKIEEVDNAIS